MQGTLFLTPNAQLNASGKESGQWSEKYSSMLSSNLTRFDGREDLPEVHNFIASVARALKVHSQTGSEMSFQTELGNLSGKFVKRLYAIKGNLPTYRQGRFQGQINVVVELSKRLQK